MIVRTARTALLVLAVVGSAGALAAVEAEPRAPADGSDWEEALRAAVPLHVTVVGPGGADSFEMAVDELVQNAAAMERLGYRVAVQADGATALVSPGAFVRALREAEELPPGPPLEAVSPVVPAAPAARPRTGGVRAAAVPPAMIEAAPPGPLTVIRDFFEDAPAPAAYHVILIARRGARDKIDAAGAALCNLGDATTAPGAATRAVFGVPVTSGSGEALGDVYAFDRVARWTHQLSGIGIPQSQFGLFGFLALAGGGDPTEVLDSPDPRALAAAEPLFIDASAISRNYAHALVGDVVEGMERREADSHVDMLWLMRAVSVIERVGETVMAVLPSVGPATAAEPDPGGSGPC